jgi:hypothetical protein
MKFSRRAIKADGGRAFQIRSQDPDARSRRTGGRQSFHERWQPEIQTEDRAFIAGPFVIVIP